MGPTQLIWTGICVRVGGGSYTCIHHSLLRRPRHSSLTSLFLSHSPTSILNSIYTHPFLFFQKKSSLNPGKNQYQVCFKQLAIGIYGPAAPVTVASWDTPCSHTALVGNQPTLDDMTVNVTTLVTLTPFIILSIHLYLSLCFGHTAYLHLISFPTSYLTLTYILFSSPGAGIFRLCYPWTRAVFSYSLPPFHSA